MTAWKQPGEKVKDNITVYRLPPVLPFFNKCRAINRANQKNIAKFVREKMKEHGFDKPLLWVYSPVTVDCVDLIPHSGLVYDCVDRHSAYGGLMNPALVDAMELELAAKTNMTFATAKSLAERLQKAQPEAKFIPNGANFERFFEATKPQPVPEDMKDIPHPIFGFVGALQTCIEYGVRGTGGEGAAGVAVCLDRKREARCRFKRPAGDAERAVSRREAERGASKVSCAV